MKNKDTYSTDAAELRKQAEALEQENEARSPEQFAPLSVEATKLALHELRVHQIELEMQNEELRRAQVELDATRARYFDLYDLAPVGYVTVSEKGLILEANLTAASLLGGVRGALVNRLVSQFILKEDQDIFYLCWSQLLETGTRQVCELRMVKEDRAIFWARMEATLGRNAAATPVCRVVLSDITERKRAEDDVLENRAKLKAALASMTDAVFISDAHGQFIEFNDAFATFHRFQSKEQCAKRFAELSYLLDVFMPNGELASLEQWAVSRALRGEIVTHAEYLLRRKDTGESWIGSYSFAPIYNQDGTLAGAVVVARDITDYKRTEEDKKKLELQNRQLQKAESLGRMAGAIAHHFNNQLQAVMMGLQVAMSNLPQNTMAVEGLTDAMLSARKAAKVSTLMLTYLGQTNAKHEPLYLCEVCQQLLAALRADLPNDVVLETDFSTPGPVIHANANQIQQALVNLVTNAWEALKDTGSAIRVVVKTVCAAEIPTENRFPVNWQSQDNAACACLEVADAGSGIADKDIEKLFDPFFSSKFTGRGLGLAVVLGIVRAHKGCVTVKSQPGKGSIFRVFLPVSTEAVPQKPAPVVQEPRIAESGTVLVVDDEPVVLKSIGYVLKRSGFTVLTAVDGVDAVKVFQQHRDEIGCVLCDLTMPHMGGWETLTALRKLSPGLPVILSSGYSEEQVMAGEHPELPQAFLSKPYEWAALRNAIVRVMRKPKDQDEK